MATMAVAAAVAASRAAEEERRRKWTRLGRGGEAGRGCESGGGGRRGGEAARASRCGEERMVALLAPVWFWHCRDSAGQRVGG